jgi:hypothetical protein
MDSLKVNIYNHSSDLPEMTYTNFFHSKSLFEVYEHTPGHYPYMAVVNDNDNHILCHMLAVVRRRGSWMPPYLYSQCRIYGEGDYINSEWKREDLFAKMLTKLTSRLQLKCLYIEFSDLSTKMFAYKHFKRCKYFPVHWMEIHNSLHSKKPEERLSTKTSNRIKRSYSSGVTTSCVENDEDRNNSIKLIKTFYKSKLRHYCPPESFFRLLNTNDNGQIFITKYKKKIIGSSVCTFSNGNAYLWFLAYRKKSFPLLHPEIMSVWVAIKHAEKIGCRHIYFLDVGLPFSKNNYREFILKFGGKPVSTNRWFRFSIGWINYLFSFFYH